MWKYKYGYLKIQAIDLKSQDIGVMFYLWASYVILINLFQND